jgi:NADPH:quinone reductase-like Zn-dependent oxidoreductase
LKRNGQFITIAGDDPEANISVKTVASVTSSLISRKFWSVFGSSRHSYIFHFLNQKYQDLDEMRTKFLESGKVKPIIDTVFDWRKDGVEGLYSLYEKSKSGKAQGKLILKIADEE